MAELTTALRTGAQHSPAFVRWFGKASPGSFLAFWALFDSLIVVVTAVLSNWLRFGDFEPTAMRKLAIALALAIVWVAFRHVGLHLQTIASRPLAQLRRATKALVMTFLIIVSVGYATKVGADVSRLWVGIWFGWAFLAFVATRPLVASAYSQLERSGTFDRTYAVFVTNENIQHLDSLLHRWQSQMPRSSQIAAIFVDKPDQIGERTDWHGLIKGSFDDFVTWRERGTIDHAVILMPPEDSRGIEPVLDRLGAVAVDVDLIAGNVDEVWARRPVTKIAGLPSIRIMTRPLDAQQIAMKRLEDMVVASLALILLGPLMLAVAVAVRLDSPGPVLFCQRRHGFNNRIFRIYKFRTMRHSPAPPSTVEQAKREDPRVTRVGAFLRKTSLDELPQLFNVFSGEMSIVGPRPHAIEHNDLFAQRIRSYLARHRVKPGITGWAQVNGFRGETEQAWKMDRRVEYDLFYVDNWSLVFDIKIMVKTFRCLIHPNAY